MEALTKQPQHNHRLGGGLNESGVPKFAQGPLATLAHSGWGFAAVRSLRSMFCPQYNIATHEVKMWLLQTTVFASS